MATYRAELIRAHADVLGGVDIQNQGHGSYVLDVSFLSSMSGAQISDDLDMLGKSSPAFASASETLREAGIEPHIDAGAVSDIATACEVQDSIIDRSALAAAGIPDDVEPLSFRSDSSGQLEVHVPSKYSESLENVVSPYRAAVKVVPDDSLPVPQGRGDSYANRFGGSAMKRTDGTGETHICSDAFRVNGIGLLTASHCSFNDWYALNPTPSVLVGNSSSDLIGANVDAKLLTGTSYSRQVWVGGPLGSGTLLGINYVPAATVPTNGSGQYLFSGGYSGQGTITVVQKPSGSVCAGPACWLYLATTSDPICIPGDSGAPSGLYNPGNGQLAALGVHQGGVPGSSCGETSAEVIVYLYGGATIG